MPRRRTAVLTVAAAVVAAAVVVVGVTAFSSADDQNPRQKADTRRLVLILAGVSPHADSTRFDLELATRTEALTQTCMTAHGYQYTPKDPYSLVDPAISTDFTSLAYAQRYGFGISTFPSFTRSVADDAYVKSLSSQARAAYGNALSTCANDAQSQARTEYGISEANSEWERIDGEVQRDARYQAALVSWRACASRAGYPAASRLAAIKALRTRYQSVMADVQKKVHGVVSQDQIAAIAAADPVWQSFHRDEVALATATFPCSQPVDETYAAVFQENLDKGR
jgi:negative regulator of sigma E activity